MTQEKEALEMALEALEKIAMVNAMDYEYQRWAKEHLATIKEALAQPKQKPVAWRWENKGEDKWLNKYIYLDNGAPDYPEECEPLYTTPPQRKPLTDEGIREVLLDFPKHIGEWYDRDFVRFIRAIEAAHGIKEKV